MSEGTPKTVSDIVSLLISIVWKQKWIFSKQKQKKRHFPNAKSMVSYQNASSSTIHTAPPFSSLKPILQSKARILTKCPREEAVARKSGLNGNNSWANACAVQPKTEQSHQCVTLFSQATLQLLKCDEKMKKKILIFPHVYESQAFLVPIIKVQYF